MFDPSQFAGLPLNVMALMPVLVHHFDQPTEFCIKVVSEIQQVSYWVAMIEHFQVECVMEREREESPLEVESPLKL